LTKKKKRRKPNWRRWERPLTLMLWQAVALSLNIEPDDISENEIVDQNAPDLARFYLRLREAQDAVALGRLPSGQRPS
jgi:hypothetical protein